MSQFPDPYAQQTSPPAHPPSGPPKSSGNSWVFPCLITFVVIAVVGVVVCGGGIWYAYSNAKTLMTDAVIEVAHEAIAESEMQEEDKQIVTAQVDRIGEAFKRGDITFEELVEFLQGLAESPEFVVVLVQQFANEYINQSDLSDEEKTAAKRTLQRVARGIVEEKIDREELNGALDPIMETDAEGGRSLKDAKKVTTEELQEALANCKKLADDAEIPDEAYDVNIGEEVKKAVDEALGEGL